ERPQVTGMLPQHTLTCMFQHPVVNLIHARLQRIRESPSAHNYFDGININALLNKVINNQSFTEIILIHYIVITHQLIHRMSEGFIENAFTVVINSKFSRCRSWIYSKNSMHITLYLSL